MNTQRLLRILFLIIFMAMPLRAGELSSFAWLDHDYAVQESIATRISLPEGFTRTPLPSGSFSHWLRHLPLKPGNPPVYLFNGSLKGNQNAHAAVIDIDTGSRNLQQCADAAIRLRAEYLWEKGDRKNICFKFTSGDSACWEPWVKGMRPLVEGSHVSWIKSVGPDGSHDSFRQFLNTVFAYAGSYSLSRELLPVNSMEEIRVGDMLVQGGFPGHVVVVVDTAENRVSGEKIFLLAQSFMPAQEIHLLKNPGDPTISPWYRSDDKNPVVTPEWVFQPGDLMRW